jgi:Fe-S-cluster containining protein
MTPEELRSAINSLPDTECSCQKCQGGCKWRPCWGTPEEIQKLIDLGYIDRLMNDWWVGNFTENNDDVYPYDVQIIAPAIVGREGDYAPSFIPFGACAFLTPEGLCEIHVCKPAEGRKRKGCDKTELPFNLHEYIARTWDTEEGRTVVRTFCEKHNLT